MTGGAAIRDALVVVFGDPPRPDIIGSLERAGAPGRATLMGLVPVLPASQEPLRVGGTDRSMDALLVEARTRRLEDHARALGEGIEVRVEPGDVRAVIEAFVAGGHDLVVVVGERTPAARLVIARLLELCPGPVMVEPRPGVDAGPNVIAAIDPDAGVELNRTIIGAALDGARRADGDVHLLHTWSVTGEDELRRADPDAVPEADLAAYALAVEDAHRAAFDEVVTAAAPPVGPEDPRLTRHLVHGTPAEAVARLVTRDHVGLVVTGTEARRGIEGALAGSAARLIAEGDDHATLVLKAPGFVSPLLES